METLRNYTPSGGIYLSSPLYKGLSTRLLGSTCGAGVGCEYNHRVTETVRFVRDFRILDEATKLSDLYWPLKETFWILFNDKENNHWQRAHL